MRIRTRSHLFLAIYLILMTILAIGSYITTQKIGLAVNKVKTSKQMVHQIFELNMLTQDYLLHQTERAKQQWQAIHSSMGKLITQSYPSEKELERFYSSKEKHLLRELEDAFIAINKMFSRITQTEISPEIRDRLAFELILKNREIVRDIVRLSEIAQKQIINTQTGGIVLNSIFLLCLAVVIVLGFYAFNFPLIKSLTKLEDGAQVIGKGNFEHRIDIKTKDEVGFLARAFNQMTENLKNITASRDELHREISDRKQAEKQIRQMAYHDSLTGLPNRKLFSDRLGIALTQAQRNKKEVGIAMLDLDNFKDVNDTLGHDVGDLLLKATAERLSAALRKGDTVARMGGDEFALILPDLKGVQDAIQVAQKIVESFRKPFLIDTHQLVVTTSIGIAVYPDDGIDEGVLVKNADIAMYQAKEAGRNRCQIYIKA